MTRLSDRHVVVCVDDDPEVLRALRRALRREPYEVLCTGKPAEALDWIQSRNVSLIITDQLMPEMAGTELLEEVWRQRPDTTRVVLTGHPSALTFLGDPPIPVQHTVTKPWNPEDLRRTIQRILHEREFEEGDLEPENGN